LKPRSQQEQEIAAKIDAKARIIAEEEHVWGTNIINKMKIAVGFELSQAHDDFILKYTEWRSKNPL
jgi:hypothetical protein